MSNRYRHEIRKRLEKQRRPEQPWPGRLGDGQGTVTVPGNTGLCYVRPEGSDLPVIVYKGAAPDIEGYPVWVGRDFNRRRVVKVLGINEQAASGSGESQAVDAHGDSHTLGGSDTAWVSTQQVLEALVYASSGMNVVVNAGWVVAAGKPVKLVQTTVDMTSHIPTGAAYCLILSNSSGAISVQDGTPAASLADLAAADIPTAAAGYVVLALVRLYEGQTALNRTVNGRDVWSLPLAPADVSGAGGGDAGDITYTPAVLTDWDSDADPGDVDNALDQLAERVDDVEALVGLKAQVLFTIEGTLSTGDGTIRIPNHTGRTLTIAGVYLDCTTAPTGAALIVDIHKSGTTIFTTQSNRPQIAADAYAGNSTTIEVDSWADGEYLTMHRDQVGSTVAGADLTVTVVYS